MPDVQMDFDMMEELATIFRNGAQQLEDTQRAMQSIAQALEDGALWGDAGEMLGDGLRFRLNAKLARLQDKFEELAGDVSGALSDLRDGDHEAASRFK